jgi:hypothetical protein
MTDKTEAMDNLIAQDADLIDAQPTQSDNNFQNLPLSESFERVAKVAEERAAFNEQMAIRALLEARGLEIREKNDD